MGLAVDAPGHATHHDETGRREVAREGARHRAAVRRAGTRPHQSDRLPVEERHVPSSAEVEPRRRIVNRREQRRERWIAAPDAADLRHFAASSPGIRYESASAT